MPKQLLVEKVGGGGEKQVHEKANTRSIGNFLTNQSSPAIILDHRKLVRVRRSFAEAPENVPADLPFGAQRHQMVTVDTSSVAYLRDRIGLEGNSMNSLVYFRRAARPNNGALKNAALRKRKCVSTALLLGFRILTR